MKTRWAVFIACGLFGALPAACGGDDDDGAAGSGGNGGGSAGTGGSPVTDACTNATDSAAIDATYGGAAGAGGAGQTYNQVIASCGLDCLDINDFPGTISCAQACVAQATDNAVSAQCTDCFTQSALCAFENCIGACAVNQMAQGCTDCRCNSGCEAAFTVCSGVDRGTCG